MTFTSNVTGNASPTQISDILRSGKGIVREDHVATGLAGVLWRFKSAFSKQAQAENDSAKTNFLAKLAGEFKLDPTKVQDRFKKLVDEQKGMPLDTKVARAVVATVSNEFASLRLIKAEGEAPVTGAHTTPMAKPGAGNGAGEAMEFSTADGAVTVEAQDPLDGTSPKESASASLGVDDLDAMVNFDEDAVDPSEIENNGRSPKESANASLSVDDLDAMVDFDEDAFDPSEIENTGSLAVGFLDSGTAVEHSDKSDVVPAFSQNPYQKFDDWEGTSIGFVVDHLDYPPGWEGKANFETVLTETCDRNAQGVGDKARFAMSLSKENLQAFDAKAASYESLRAPEQRMQAQFIAAVAFCVGMSHQLGAKDALGLGLRMIELVGSGRMELKEALANLSNTLETQAIFHHFDLPLEPSLIEIQGDVREFKSNGEMNKVYAAKAVLSSEPEDVILKPVKIKDERGGVSVHMQLPTLPKHALRNIASFAVDQALGFGVICPSHLCRYKDQNGQHGVGLVMPRAPGVSSHELAPTCYDNGNLRRELTKLQILDAIVGQGDRHRQNILVDMKEGGEVRVTGIDNDQCLGRRPTDPDLLSQASRSQDDLGYRGCRMPRVIDEDMAAAIRDLSEETLKEALRQIDQPCVDAALERLKNLKAFADSEGCVKIKASDWETVEVSMDFDVPKQDGERCADMMSSYFARGKIYAMSEVLNAK